MSLSYICGWIDKNRQAYNNNQDLAQFHSPPKFSLVPFLVNLSPISGPGDTELLPVTFVAPFLEFYFNGIMQLCGPLHWVSFT